MTVTSDKIDVQVKEPTEVKEHHMTWAAVSNFDGKVYAVFTDKFDAEEWADRKLCDGGKVRKVVW